MEFEGMEYLSIDEAAKIVGWNRATIWKWVERMHMTTHKFVGNRRAYLKAADVARLKEIKEKPWTAGEVVKK